MDNLRRADQLFQWTEQQQLNFSQLQLAEKQFNVQPTQQHWLTLANYLLLFGSVVLLASGLIFFFAHNWPLMHYLAKLALAGSAVFIAGTVAVFSPIKSLMQRATMLGTAVLTGALLALIGQTYQTGADIWQLFAGWAALITPLVLLSKSRGCYLLWFSLIELALLRYLDNNSWLWLLSASYIVLYLALANFVLLLLCEFVLPGLGVKKTKPLAWLSAVALMLPLTFGATLGVWETEYQPNLLCYLLLGAGLALWYFRIQRDVLIFALLLFSAIAVSTAALARLMAFSDNFFIINLLALYVIGSSSCAAVWLKKLQREQPR